MMMRKKNSNIKKRVNGSETLMLTMPELYHAAAGQDISGIMIDALKNGIWPENLFRNSSTITPQEQIVLLKSKIVIVGLGGLGGYLATLAARAGIGAMNLVDGDSFSASNLNRQVLCTKRTIGKNKARVASDVCLSINPALKTLVWETNFKKENSVDILEGVDLVIDGLDQAKTRKLLFAGAISANIPFIHGAVSGWSGQTATFMPDHPETMEILYPENIRLPSAPSVLSPVVAIIAGLQIQEAIRLLCGKSPENFGKLIFYDGVKMEFQKVNL